MRREFPHGDERAVLRCRVSAWSREHARGQLGRALARRRRGVSCVFRRDYVTVLAVGGGFRRLVLSVGCTKWLTTTLALASAQMMTEALD